MKQKTVGYKKTCQKTCLKCTVLLNLNKFNDVPLMSPSPLVGVGADDLSTDGVQSAVP